MTALVWENNKREAIGATQRRLVVISSCDDIGDFRFFYSVHENLSEKVHFVCITSSRSDFDLQQVHLVETHHWLENYIFFMPI